MNDWIGPTKPNTETGLVFLKAAGNVKVMVYLRVFHVVTSSPVFWIPTYIYGKTMRSMQDEISDGALILPVTKDPLQNFAESNLHNKTKYQQ
jgi:hypothetical protein